MQQFARAFYDAVSRSFYCDKDVERAGDPEELSARSNYVCARNARSVTVVDKESRKRFSENGDYRNYYKRESHKHYRCRSHALLYAFEVARAHVLRSESRDCVGCGDYALYAERVYFHCRGIRRDRLFSETVDKSLYEELSYRNERLLAYARYGYGKYRQKYSAVESAFDVSLAGQIEFFSVRQFFHFHNNEYKCDYTCNCLGYQSCVSKTLYAERFRHNDVEYNVAGRRTYEKYQRRNAVAHTREYGVGRIVDKYEYKTESVDLEISGAVCMDRSRCLKQLYERGGYEISHYRKYSGESEHKRERGAGCGFDRAVLMLSEQVGYDDAYTAAATYRDSDVYHCYRGRNAYRRERVVGDHLACNDAVRHIVKLLEYH